MTLKHHQQLAIFEAFLEFLPAVLVSGLQLTVLLHKLLDGFSLYHTVIYNAHKQAHNKEKEMKVQRIFLGDFRMASVEIILEMAWLNFRVIGGFLAQEMIG